jgi:hypothetical protein
MKKRRVMNGDLERMAERIASACCGMSESDDFSLSFGWHSSIGIDPSIGPKRRILANIPIEHEYTKLMFRNAGCDSRGNNILIHKTRNCLWKFDDSGKKIVPVFASDILTAEDLQEDINALTQIL